MKKIKRAVHFDFHTMPGFDNLLQNFNAEEFARKLSENHVQYINVAARCNIGFSYYNTKVGKKYPGLKRDILREIIDACHKKDIGVTAYFNVGLNHELCLDNPDWCKIDKDGKIYRWYKGGNFFRQGCFNTQYAEHIIEEIKEVVNGYDVDGIFCDCIITEPCYCANCIFDMKAKGINYANESEVVKFQEKLKLDFCKRIRQVIPKNIRCILNGIPWDEEIHSHVELECLPTGGWEYEYIHATAPYARTRFSDLWYMSGRFQGSWGDFGGIKSVASMENDLFDAMMYGFSLSFGDQLHPVNGLENEVINRIGKVFERKMAYESFDDGAVAIAEVGVLIERGKCFAENIARGFAKILCELKIPFGIYDELGDFSGLKLLIIPNDINHGEVLIQKLTTFIKKGGKVIFVGSAIDLASKYNLLDCAELVGVDDSDNAYFTLPENDMLWAQYVPSRIIKNNGGKEISKYVKPVFKSSCFDGRHYYFYKPQGEITEYSAAVVGKNTGYICFDLFTAYIEQFLSEAKQLLKRVIDELLPEKMIEVDGFPSTTIIGVTQNEFNKIVHVKTTYPEHRNKKGIIEEHTYHKGGKIVIDGEYSVYKLPDDVEIDAKIRDGKTEFFTGEIFGYKAFSLKKVELFNQ